MPTMITFTPPTTVQECDARLAQLKADRLMINAQLQDPRRRETMGRRDYAVWKSNAMRAIAYKKAEIDLLGSWKQHWDDARQAADRVRRQQIRSAAEIEQQRRDDRNLRAAEAGEETDLIFRLLTALGRLYRITKLSPSELDTEAMNRARAFLVAAEVLEP